MYSKQIQEKSETPVQGVHYASPAAIDVYQPRPSQGRGKVTCYRCNSNHFPSACRFKQSICNKCKKIGHIAPACPSKKPADKGITTKHSHHVDEQYEVGEPEGAEYSMYNITHKKGDDPIYIDVTMNGIHVKMELDTGSGLTIINEQMYSEIAKPNQLNPLQKTDIILKTYSTQVKRLTSWDQHKLWLVTKEKRWRFQCKWSKVWDQICWEETGSTNSK